MRIKRTVLLILFLLNPAFAFAIQDTEDNGAVLYGGLTEKEVYSLGNYAENIKTSGASVDVITLDEIKNQGSPVLTQLLNQAAGLTVQTESSPGSPSSLRMRGTDRVRLTIDGIRADRPSMTSPGMEFQYQLTDDLERVEIIRGPQGNVGGVNASGGLIALQTRRGRGPISIEMGSEMGNYGSYKERFAIMGGDDKKDYYMGLTWFKTNGGMRATGLGTIDNNAYNNLSVVTNTGLRVLDGKAEIRDIFRFSRARKDIGINFHNDYPYTRYQAPYGNYGTNIDIMNVLSFDHTPTEWYNYNTKFGLYHNQSNNFIYPDFINTDPTMQSLSKIGSTRLNFMTQHNFNYREWNTFSVGYNLETEFIDSKSTMVNFGMTDVNNFTGSTIQNDVFVNDSINIKDKLFIRGGARLVNNSAYGTYVLPNASAALVLPTFKIKGAKTKFRGSWGQSVNTPTLYQRFARMRSMGYDMIPNPNLAAEKMTGWDVGIEQSFFNDKLTFDFGYFNNDYRDYINFEYGLTSYMYTNVDSARIQGYEARMTWTPNEKFKAIMNYTYTDSENDATGTDLPACPKNRLNTTLYWTPHERFNGYVGLEAASSRAMDSSVTAVRTPGYVDVRIGANVRLFSFKGAHVYLKAMIYNLLDQKISMYRQGDVYYYAPGIQFMAGVFVKYTLPEKENI